MSIDTVQLKYFLEVGTLGSIKRAAANLNITQSALSRRMAQLETEIGIPLLERSPTGVAPTAGGRELMIRAAEIISILDSVKAAAQNAVAPETDNIIKVAMVSSASSRILDKLIVRYAREMPDYLLRVETASSGGVRDGSVKLKIGRMETPDDKVESEPLWGEALLLVAPPGSSLDDIRGMTYIVAASDPDIRKLNEKILKDFAIQPARTVNITPAAEALRLIEADNYSILPYSLFQSPEQLKQYSIFHARRHRTTIHMSWLYASSKTPALSKLREIIRQLAEDAIANDRTGFLFRP